MQGNFNQTQRVSIKGKISLTGNLPCNNSYKKINWGSSRFIHIMLIKRFLSSPITKLHFKSSR